ncbi:hypothetical protein [Nannocystis sp. SCPEA4]|uniref:hypothetical protein n=1 Tax=Nannocystis sp. SCPEA4 TaxID=2996787 RepID=UPI00227015DA|nr:hypothetical protein [Nannocystis sp. SCPEA4]MCY1054756.1 hypothetical protein [Nannocystis sp. SCPEA4]
MSIDRKDPPRSHVVTSGTFAAVPEGFEGGVGSLRYVLKPEFQAVPVLGRNQLATWAVPRGHALLDLSAVNLADLDQAAVQKDVELVSAAIRDHFPELLKIVSAFGPQGTAEQQARALEIAERLKLTEAAAARAGGGLLGMVVIVGACLFASCFANCPPPHGGETTPPDK